MGIFKSLRSCIHIYNSLYLQRPSFRQLELHRFSELVSGCQAALRLKSTSSFSNFDLQEFFVDLIFFAAENYLFQLNTLMHTTNGTYFCRNINSFLRMRILRRFLAFLKGFKALLLDYLGRCFLNAS